MIKNILIIIAVLSFSSCSLPDFKTHPNAWQHRSASAFNSYTKNFLRTNDALANSDLKRSIAHAKNSADLTSLARIYLGECALHVSVGVEDDCKKYDDISNLVDSKELDAYKNFIMKNLRTEQINLLPKHYQDFALHVYSSNFKEANKNILQIKIITSKLLSATLMKENLEEKVIKQLIKDTSFYGYKKAVIFWLKELKNRTKNKLDMEKIDKKISILDSK